MRTTDLTYLIGMVAGVAVTRAWFMTCERKVPRRTIWNYGLLLVLYVSTCIMFLRVR